MLIDAPRCEALSTDTYSTDNGIDYSTKERSRAVEYTQKKNYGAASITHVPAAGQVDRWTGACIKASKITCVPSAWHLHRFHPSAWVQTTSFSSSRPSWMKWSTFWTFSTANRSISRESWRSSKRTVGRACGRRTETKKKGSPLLRVHMCIQPTAEHTGTDLNLAFSTILERMAIIKQRVGEETFKQHRHTILLFTDGGSGFVTRASKGNQCRNVFFF